MKQLGQRLGVKGILPPEPEGVGLSEISLATCLLSGNLLLDSIVFFFFPPKIFCRTFSPRLYVKPAGL